MVSGQDHRETAEGGEGAGGKVGGGVLLVGPGSPWV
jgi:hypothetical protein